MFSPFSAHGEVENRGLLVAQLGKPSSLSSRRRILKIVDTAKACKLNTIFIQVYRGNQAWFLSQTADSKPYRECLRGVGSDPLELLIKEAHAQGIKVYAWMNLLSLSENSQASIIKKYGTDILTRNLNEKKTLKDYKIDNQYFLEPGDLNVRRELSQLVEELIQTHPDMDGILFDYIRYPDTKPDYGYTLINMSRFKSAHPGVKIDKESPVWKNWKREQVNDLLKLLVERARALRPGIQAAATACAPYVRAYYEAYQDWPSWVNTNLVDFVLLMSYPANVKDFSQDVQEAKGKVKDTKKLLIALPAYKLKNSPEIFSREFQEAKRSKTGGYAVFHYDSLLESPALADTLKNNSGDQPVAPTRPLAFRRGDRGEASVCTIDGSTQGDIIK